MQKTNIEKINDSVSLLGFGCMRLPIVNSDNEKIDYEAGFAAIDYAYKHGVNYFDTAYGYHGGESETFIGKALEKYPRESFFLATKLPPWKINSVEDLETTFNEQLTKCRVNYFDFYLEHCLNDENYKRLESYNAYDFLLEKKKKGIIRHLGFSFHGTPECLEKILSEHEWDFVQIQYNYLDTVIADAQKQYDIIKKYNLPIIIMEPVRGGALADLCDEANDLFKKARPNMSIASWAIRYAASTENVITVLSGMSDMNQVVDNVKTIGDFEPITDADKDTIDSAAKVFRDYFTIPCTKCRYCTKDCPQGIDIPEMLRLYGQYKMEKDGPDYNKEYHQVEEKARAKQCISCHLCESFCPQKIKIAGVMSSLKELNTVLDIKD